MPGKEKSQSYFILEANAKVRTLKEIAYILGNIGHCFSYTVFIYFLIF